MHRSMTRMSRLVPFAASAALGWSTGLAAGELPVPCAAGSCGNTVGSWVTQGSATAVAAGNRMDITQSTSSATLNWSSFNIGADSAVTFRQPDASSVALNRIFQADASRILGALKANGQVYLLNQNGILFGAGSSVNVGGLLASSLNISQAAVDNGIARASQSAQPAFAAFRDADGTELSSGAVRVEPGARIEAAGGQVLLFAPEISNQGTIRTPDGQTILAAGTSVYLATSTDPDLRGLLVEVGVGGTVSNGSEASSSVSRRPEDLLGQIFADRGNVTLAGLAVNQLGRVSATTTVRQNGSIRLQARDGGSARPNSATGIAALVAANGGTVTVGPRSTTQVALDLGSAETTVDANAQPRSQISMDARRINILDSSRVEAMGGAITIDAHDDPQREPGSAADRDTSRIYIADNAALDVSGASVAQSVDRNVIRVELRGSQLQDSPVQRDGPLRSAAVFVDVRQSGARADGSTWRGTPLADASGDIATIARGVAERNLSGGTISLRSQGEVILHEGATLDVSGGHIDFRDGFVNTTSLIGTDGRLYDMANADRDRTYAAIATGGLTRFDQRWGVTRSYDAPGGVVLGRYEAGYREGKDAGSLNILAPVSILDGSIRGEVDAGRNQRLPTTLTPPANALYRAFNELPRGARFTLGNTAQLSNPEPQFVTAGIEIAPGLLLPGLRDGAGNPFDPLAAESLPLDVQATRIRPSLFGTGLVVEGTLLTNGLLTVAESSTLKLPGGGRIAANAGRINVRGAIEAPSGSIAFTAQRTLETAAGDVRLEVDESARLTARGAWVNDSPDLFGAASQAPLLIRGGDVSLTARQGDLSLAQGSLIDVSGGARRDVSGRIQAGAAGSITLSASPIEGEVANIENRATRLDLNGDLRAWSLGQGGTLSVSANSLCIADAYCGGDEPSVLWMTPASLTAGGFESVRLTATRGGLSILENTSLDLRQRNLELTRDTTLVPTGTDLLSFTRQTSLLEHLRRPMSLSLTNRISTGGVQVDADSFATVPDLSIGRGARIETDARGSVALRSTSRIIVAGAIVAPAGSIDMQLDPDLDVAEFLPSQGIWLGQDSVLAAPGFARVLTNDLGQHVGTVFDAGTVSLTARRGYVVANTGSRIDVSGTRARLDLATQGLSSSQRTPTLVGSAGGTLNITAAEGAFLDAALAARAGESATERRPAAGSLLVDLDANLRRDPDTQFTSRFPMTPRAVELTSAGSALVIAPGHAVPATLNGRALLSAESIAQGGFDSVTLAANTIEGVENATASLVPGAIRFTGPVDLTVARRLTLDAAAITGTGGDVRLSAPYIAIGHTDRTRQQVPVLASGSGTLRVEAQLLDVVGASAINGFARSELVSSGDIRARGVQGLSARSIEGSLSTSGDLALTADQIYPSTLSQFRFAVSGADERVLQINGTGDPRSEVFSAGGSLTLQAPTIVQSGVLRAPVGTINLVAQNSSGEAGSLLLAPGSLTSTSADGLTIPFGSTQGGFDWVYELEDNQTLVFEPGGANLPAQQVNLDAAKVDFRPGATLDISGGGDLLAYEFLPGPGGSRDVLSGTVRPNQFAILPGLKAPFAPFDQREYRGYALRPGDSVHLAGANGLDAGDYVLLPARYALLPGAYRVTPVSGYTDIGQSERFSQADGSTVVAGYRTFAGIGIGDTRASGFAVRSAESARRDALYTTATANDFFAAQALAGDTTRLLSPRDAGAVAIKAAEQLVLDGTLRGVVPAAGRGSRIDVTSARVRVGDPSVTPEAGEVVVDASALNRLGAQSVLIGGLRRQSASGTEILVSADRVTLDEGAHVSGPEIMLAARDRVLVDTGSRISASAGAGSGQTETLSVLGDGALLRVGSGAAAEIVRTASAGTSGVLELRDGAIVEAPGGSVFLDASGDLSSRAQLDVRGGALGFGAQRVSFGDAPEGTTGLLLSASELGALSLDELTLASRSSIDFYGQVELATHRLSLIASELKMAGSEDSFARLSAADTLTLKSRATTSSVLAPASGARRLELSARDVEYEGGALGISGAADFAVKAARKLIFAGDGMLDVGGDLSIAASRIVSRSGIDTDLRATGRFASLLPEAGAATLSATPDLGGRLSVLARSIDHRGVIALPGGAVSLHATGTSPQDGVAIGGGGTVETSGREIQFDDTTVSAPGGSIALISDFGDVSIAPDAALWVAAPAGNAGAVELRAVRGRVDVQGDLRGTGAAGARGAEIAIDALQLARFPALNGLLNANGFTAARTIRQRGPGDLIVGAGETVTAQRFTLSADQGAISVFGAIDARGAAGGFVNLNARDAITVAGTIDAVATALGAAGGRIDLMSGGAVHLAGGSMLELSAGEPIAGADAPREANLNIRLPREQILSNGLSLAGRIEGAPRITVEGYRHYNDAAITAADTLADGSNVLYREAEEFAASASTIAAALNRSDDPKFLVVPGIELRSDGDMRLSSDWNLSQWRFNDAPGVLTLRSKGTLFIDRSISDGFAEVSGEEGFRLPEDPGRSWSYRLAAGADTASSNPLGLLDTTQLAGATRGDLRLIAGQPTNFPSGARMIRTGTGSIDIAAASDVTLGNRASVIYTAGVAGHGLPLSSDIAGELAYPTAGGDISIFAQGNIVGAPGNQLVTDWLWRTGRSAEDIPIAWTVNFQRFQQGVGALGGGSVKVTAGGNVDNLSVSLPSIGRQVGGTTFTDSRVEIVGGGALNVRAGQSLRGGSYYVGRGAGTLRAGNGIGATSALPNAFAPILALGDAQVSAQARRGLLIDGIVNPTLLPQGLSQGASFEQTYFATYAPESSVSLTATAGNLMLRDTPSSLVTSLNSMSFTGNGNPLSLRIAAPTLRAHALGGNLLLDGAIGLFPSPLGTLELLADRDIRMASTLQITLSDADVSILPAIANPQESFGTLSLLVQPGSIAPNFHADAPVHARADGRASEPVRLIARTGDVVTTATATGAPVSLFSAKPLHVSAGRDVLDLSAIVQNLSAADVSTVRAGRDVRYSTVRGVTGGVLETLANISVDGPGRLLVEAGRNVDLQASAGILTRGNLFNPALPAAGASISLLAGPGNSPPDYSAFTERYLASPDRYGAELVNFMKQQTGEALDFATALARFRSLGSSAKRPLIERLLFAELRASGREAARTGSKDFSRAFEALEMLYPGSNPDADAGEANRYAGDIRLFFSRIYTLAGGDIDLIAPGGEINVGLATPPVAFGIQKAASSLGIVVQSTGSLSALAFRDFQVNESRVFAADGGNILVWSTRGDIDAGRGAKTAISAPPPTILVDPRTGRATVSRPAALTGSGIQTLATSLGRKPGDVDLFAPRGVVNAGDAGIVAGNLTIAATAVLGANNITVSGTSVGVPVDTGGLGSSLAGASNAASGAGRAAETALDAGRSESQSGAPAAEAALGWLDVFIEGFGEEVCKANDAECLKRNQRTP